MAALQSSLLLCKLPISSSPFPKRPYPLSHFCFPFPKPHSRPRTLSLPCTFYPDNINFSSNSGPAAGGSGIGGDIPDFSEKFEDSGAVSEKLEAESEGVVVGMETELGSGEAGPKLVGEEERKRRVSIVALVIGAWAAITKVFQSVFSRLTVNWFGLWWRMWRENEVKRLMAEADANPKDAAKQSALLAELNKIRPESVVARFEQGEYAADSKVVAEYIRALVATNSISEYLPDEKSGKPSTLPALLQELKHRATGNMDEAVLSPGISNRRPLHVVLVDPKIWSKMQKVLQGFFSVLSTVVVVVIMGMAFGGAIQRYLGSLGGIGAAGGVGANSSYSTPKEVNREVMPEKTLKTFKDVKGCDEAKEELEEVVQYLKNPEKFTRLGGKLPKGILLTGAPGTGKTLLAKAIAGEAGVPFFYRAGSEFEEMFVGVGARRVRSLFQAAKKKAPCIIFIDEIDAVGSTRKQWEGHTKKTLHQLLVEMDGFDENEGIILIAATNLPEILDPALTRAGRFDRHIVVPNPDVKGREEILELYVQDKPLGDDVDVKSLARGTPGFNGADLANLVNLAAVKAAIEGAEKITATQMEFAKDRILMGAVRRTMDRSEESKKLTAYHESGHAIVAFYTEGADPIHKATIVARGSALGMVALLPSSDETSVSKKQLLARLDVCMGGRAAEELIFGSDHITTGASSDLQTATELARYMVSSCGMSDKIGPIHIKERPSAEMQSNIDAEVSNLLREAYDRVKALLKKQEKALHALAFSLLKCETLTLEDIKGILNPYRGGQFSEQQVEQEQQEEGDPIF